MIHRRSARDRRSVAPQLSRVLNHRIVAGADVVSLALLLTLVCLILLAVTAFGIFSLTSYWVSQRRRQIGIRRALGATRLAIMQHFQAEKFRKSPPPIDQ